MKKLIVLSLITFCSLSMFAQADSTRITPIDTKAVYSFGQKDYRFTFSLAPLISWISPDTKNIKSDGSRLGYSGALMVEKNLSNNVAFAFGLGINQMGGKINYPILDVSDANNDTTRVSNVSYTYKTRYVELPAMMKLRTDEFGYSRIYFEAGLALGFIWRAKADIDKTIFTDEQGGNEDRNVNDNRNDFNGATSSAQEDNIRGLRIPLLVGAGWEYALSSNTVYFMGVRYSAGLTNIMRADDTKAFNNYVSLNIGLLF